MIPQRKSQIYPCNQRNNNGPASNRKEDSKPSKVRFAITSEQEEVQFLHQIKPKPRSSKPRSKTKTILHMPPTLADSNCAQILPTMVYINPDLAKVKLETDYVPGTEIAIKSEPGTEIGQAAVFDVGDRINLTTVTNLLAEEIVVKEEVVEEDLPTEENVAVIIEPQINSVLISELDLDPMPSTSYNSESQCSSPETELESELASEPDIEFYPKSEPTHQSDSECSDAQIMNIEEDRPRSESEQDSNSETEQQRLKVEGNSQPESDSESESEAGSAPKQQRLNLESNSESDSDSDWESNPQRAIKLPQKIHSLGFSASKCEWVLESTTPRGIKLRRKPLPTLDSESELECHNFQNLRIWNRPETVSQIISKLQLHENSGMESDSESERNQQRAPSDLQPRPSAPFWSSSERNERLKDDERAAQSTSKSGSNVVAVPRIILKPKRNSRLGLDSEAESGPESESQRAYKLFEFSESESELILQSQSPRIPDRQQQQQMDSESELDDELEPKTKPKPKPQPNSKTIPCPVRDFENDMDKVLKKIFCHLSTKDLLNCSLVNRQWNKIARLILQEDRTVYAVIDRFYPCRELLKLNKLIHSSSTHSLKVPYNGLSFQEKSAMPYRLHEHEYDEHSLETIGEDEFSAIISSVKFKYLPLNGTLLTTTNQQCPAFKLIGKILQVQASNLLGIKLQPFFYTGEDSNRNYFYEYETCMRKFSDFFPSLENHDGFLESVKEIEIVQKDVYDSKNNIYLEILKSQLNDLLQFTPKVEVIKGFICSELLQVVSTHKKIPFVKDLKVFLRCGSVEDQDEALSKLTHLRQVIFNSLQLENLEIGTFFDWEEYPSLLKAFLDVILFLWNNSLAHLKSLSITHRDFLWIFGGKVQSDLLGFSRVEHLSISNYDCNYKVDPAGMLMACAINFRGLFPRLKSIFVDLKNPPTRPLFKRLDTKIYYEILKSGHFPFRPCESVVEIQVDATMKEGKGEKGMKNGTLTKKIMTGFIKSFPNVKKFVSDDEKGNPEELKDLLEMIFCQDSLWEGLEIVRFNNVALWGKEGNLDSWMKTISDGNVPRSLKRLEIKIGKHCRDACSNGELFLNQRQQLVSKEVAKLVMERVPRFSVEIDGGICTGAGNCYYTLPSHFENHPGFLKCVTSFQD